MPVETILQPQSLPKSLRVPPMPQQVSTNSFTTNLLLFLVAQLHSCQKLQQSDQFSLHQVFELGTSEDEIFCFLGLFGPGEYIRLKSGDGQYIRF